MCSLYTLSIAAQRIQQILQVITMMLTYTTLSAGIHLLSAKEFYLFENTSTLALEYIPLKERLMASR